MKEYVYYYIKFNEIFTLDLLLNLRDGHDTYQCDSQIIDGMTDLILNKEIIILGEV